MDSQLTDWSFEWAGMVQDHAGGVILLQHAIDALQAKATTPVNITLWAVQTESRDWLPVVNGRSNSVQQYSWQMPVDEFKRYGDSLFSSGTVDISEGSGWQSVFCCGDHVQHNHAVTHWLCGKGNAYIGVLALHSERVSNTVSSADTQLVESCLPTLERIVQNPAFSITELQNTLLLQPKSYEQVAEEERLISMGRLVASITHEVNNPLGVAITGVSHFRDALHELHQHFNQGTLTEAVFSSFVKESEDIAERLAFNLERAVKLLGDFKDSAVNQSADTATRFMLDKIILSTVNSLHPELKRHGITIAVGEVPSIPMLSYPGALSQILTNLVFNSINHAFAGMDNKKISIHCGYDVITQTVTLNYRDNGCGIPKLNQKAVFEPYFTTRRGTGGSGIGLAIVNTLTTNKLRGTLHLESAEHAGVSFTFTLPVNSDNLTASNTP